MGGGKMKIRHEGTSRGGGLLESNMEPIM